MERVVSELKSSLSVDSRAGVRWRRVPQRLVGVVLIGAWVAMPLLPVAAILLSWLNGLS